MRMAHGDHGDSAKHGRSQPEGTTFDLAPHPVQNSDDPGGGDRAEPAAYKGGPAGIDIGGKGDTLEQASTHGQVERAEGSGQPDSGSDEVRVERWISEFGSP